MYITRKSGLAVLLVLLHIFVINCSGKKMGSDPPKEIVIPSKENAYFLKEHYKEILNGIWNTTGMQVEEGNKKEFSWGKARRDQNCVTIDFGSDSPFITGPGEKLIIGKIDFSNASQNELIFALDRDGGKQRLKLSIRIRGERAILFTELEGHFLWDINIKVPYYKISGPGMNE
jgi:hypothetical protein